ncbi:MAG: tripartite tricarboxylate transporter substrate binding protein [Burkholderiales bacterium]
MKQTCIVGVLAAAALGVAGSAVAQDYPARPIRVIVPFAAGGPGDVQVRLVGQKLTEALGQTVIVDNRGGANSIVGTELVAKAAPDGYTVLMVTAGYTVNVTLYPKLPYDSLKDLAPLTLMTKGPAIVVVHPSLPAKNIRELIAVAKARPGQLVFASSGTGSPSQLAVELFQIETGTRMIHVPYKGMAPGMTDLLAGQVQLAFPTIVAGVPLVQAGKLRALAVTGAQRTPAVPTVPTVAEAGVPGYEATNWYGLLVPGATPAPVVAKLNTELNRILRLPDVSERLLGLGMDPAPTATPQEFGTLIRGEITKWAKVVKTSGVKPE